MNTFLAFYLWLMQLLGVPTLGPVVEQLTQPDTVRQAEQAPPPPENDDAPAVGDREVRTFISNGF